MKGDVPTGKDDVVRSEQKRRCQQAEKDRAAKSVHLSLILAVPIVGTGRGWAHTSLGHAKLQALAWGAAEREFQTAIRLHTRYAPAYFTTRAF